MEKKLYVYGDSLCKGIVLNEMTEKYEICNQNFIQIITDSLKSTTKNFSVFGATIEKGLKMFQRSEKRIEENGIALIEFGGNDCDFLWAEVAETPDDEHQPNTPLILFKEKYMELIQSLKNKNILPVILNLPPLDENRYFKTFSKNLNKENLLKFLGGTTKRIYQWHESYNNMVNQIAINTDTKIIDIRENFLTELHPEQFICADGIHPNERGHALIAKTILENL